MPERPDDDGFSRRPLSAPTLTMAERWQAVADGRVTAAVRCHHYTEHAGRACYVAYCHDAGRAVTCYAHFRGLTADRATLDGYWELDDHIVARKFAGLPKSACEVYAREKHPGPLVKPFSEIGETRP